MKPDTNPAMEQQNDVWEITPVLWGMFVICAILMGVLFYDGLELMVSWWLTREEYGHGVMIPLITAFLIWQRKDQLEYIEFTGSWVGVVFVLIGVIVFFLSDLASIYTISQYAFLITVYGIALSLMGITSFRVILAPLIILFFMIPLPNFLFNDLSAQLQLISSQLGVAFIRLIDISVYLEGNVIDLGIFKLQVVEACSGLNYLFPLMTLGFIAAYFFTGALWKKVIIFISTIPITVLMNSLRIGVIGVTVEYWGVEMAEGFLHDFQGWAVFMSCTAILIFEMWLLARIGANKLPLIEAFGIEFPEPAPEDANIHYRSVTKMFIVSIMILTVAVPAAFLLEKRSEIIPDRNSFAGFPLNIDKWTGRPEVMESIFLDKLKLTDYAFINYTSDNETLINFYSAYYESQRKDSTTHSPRACLPGGGWRVISSKKVTLDNVTISSIPLNVNRFVIEKDGVRQLVYYWFKQRDRIVTNEQMIKWYFFIDSIQKQRTDGALIRLTTVVPQGKSMDAADKRLTDFVSKISPIISEYVPD
ncbi:MAG: VPLPA-CTERM-specific exosortase XrtD [Gammaproteobacteria bacterium]|nr:VPLPA-CTERM-specific exosortase XrtD [Gammaproteobacteria bacterium]